MLRYHKSFSSPVQTSVDELVALRDLASVLKRSSRRRVKASQTGAVMSKILGRGLDFAEVRNYQAGDDVRMIDWNVTARTGTAHTKLFVEERERPVFLVIDHRSDMRFATRGMFKSVLAARLAALLGWGAIAHNDNVGGMVFTDQRHLEVKPQAGRRGLMMLFRAIEKAQGLHATQPQSDGQIDSQQVADAGETRSQTDLAQQLSRLRHIVPTGCSIFIFSDFSGFDQKCESAMGPLLQRCDVLAVMINDPLDLSLPPAGHYAMADAGGKPAAGTAGKKLQRVGIATHHKNINAHYVQHQQNINNNLERFFSRRRGRFVAVATNDDISDLGAMLMHQASLSS